MIGGRRGTSGHGGSNAMLVVDTSDALRAMAALEWAISPLSASAWLGMHMAPFLSRRAQQRFANEGDETVGKWSPLKESTQEIRESMGYPADSPINRRTGELEDFITGGGNTDVRMSGLGAQLTMPGGEAAGELADKLATAQEGRGFGGFTAPSDPHTVPRPVLGLGAPDLEFALVSLNSWVHGMVSARRGGMTTARTQTAVDL